MTEIKKEKPTVARYRNNAVVVEAILVQVNYKNLTEIIEFVGANNVGPIERRPDYTLKIKTLDGDAVVYFGDYIIKGIKGECYPCRSGVFEASYERV